MSEAVVRNVVVMLFVFSFSLAISAAAQSAQNSRRRSARKWSSFLPAHRRWRFIETHTEFCTDASSGCL